MSISLPAVVRLLLPHGQVEEMKLETYLAGAVAAEIGTSAPIEALKAQAVASRSYVVSAQRHQEQNADVCTTAHCQKWKRVDPVTAPEVFRAVSETWAMVAIYEGKLINAFFFEHCDGRTRNADEMLMPALPYLRGVDCPCGFLAMKGHGVGMCKRGAIVMARRGAAFEQIMQHYYRGIVVIHAARQDKITAEARENQPISAPVAPAVELKPRPRVRKKKEPEAAPLKVERPKSATMSLESKPEKLDRATQSVESKPEKLERPKSARTQSPASPPEPRRTRSSKSAPAESAPEVGASSDLLKRIDLPSEPLRAPIETQVAALTREIESLRAQIETQVAAPAREVESPRAQIETQVAAPAREVESPRAEIEMPVVAPVREVESPRAEIETPVVASAREVESPRAEIEMPVVASVREVEPPRVEIETPVVAPATEIETPRVALDFPVAPSAIEEEPATPRVQLDFPVAPRSVEEAPATPRVQLDFPVAPRAVEEEPATPRVSLDFPIIAPAARFKPNVPAEPAPRITPLAPLSQETSSVIARRVHVDSLPGERMIAGSLPRGGIKVLIQDPHGNQTFVISGTAPDYGLGGFEQVVEEDGMYLVTIGGRVIEVLVQGETAFIHADTVF
ncbi:MAG: SpoIID/LytB domain-containing protein [Chloroflexi bacterium]|nr:SpoIID/LytB domain-containing protein [Chloroflexota bacterium]